MDRLNRGLNKGKRKGLEIGEDIFFPHFVLAMIQKRLKFVLLNGPSHIIRIIFVMTFCHSKFQSCC